MFTFHIVPVISEAASTQRADEASSGRVVDGAGIMAAHVLVKIAALCKGAVTLRADKGPLARVQAQVGLEVAALGEAAVARRTHERTVTRVNALVSPQVGRLHTNTAYHHHHYNFFTLGRSSQGRLKIMNI